MVMMLPRKVKETAEWKRASGEFSVITVPAAIISLKTFAMIQKDAEKILGVDGAAVLLYEAGKDAGKTWISRFHDEWGLKGTENEFIRATEEFYAELGWGKFSIDIEHLTISIENSFIARGYGNREAKKPVCHFLCGYNASLITELIHKEVDVEERMSMAKGDHYCEFCVVTP
jgi:predicted hydrocarbon binding protein